MQVHIANISQLLALFHNKNIPMKKTIELYMNSYRENPILTGNGGTAALITTCSKRIGLLDSQFSSMCSILSLHSFLVLIFLIAN